MLKKDALKLVNFHETLVYLIMRLYYNNLCLYVLDTDHEVPQSASKNEKYHIPNLNLKQEIITPDVKHNMEPVIDNIKSEDNRNFNQSSTPRFFRKAHRRNSSISPTSTIRSNNTEDMLK